MPEWKPCSDFSQQLPWSLRVLSVSCFQTETQIIFFFASLSFEPAALVFAVLVGKTNNSGLAFVIAASTRHLGPCGKGSWYTGWRLALGFLAPFRLGSHRKPKIRESATCRVQMRWETALACASSEGWVRA
jgi:hypothetical protein